MTANKNTFRTLVLAITLVITAVVSGCTARSAQPATQDTVTVKRHAKHVCGAPTRDGKTCQHAVKHEGDLCWVHKPIVPCTTDEDCSVKNGRNGDPVAEVK